jgi:hypothetical protein
MHMPWLHVSPASHVGNGAELAGRHAPRFSPGNRQKPLVHESCGPLHRAPPAQGSLWLPTWRHDWLMHSLSRVHWFDVTQSAPVGSVAMQWASRHSRPPPQVSFAQHFVASAPHTSGR